MKTHCMPFESSDAANAAVEKFLKEFDKLRIEHGMANAVVILKGSHLNKEREEIDFGVSIGFGNGVEFLSMIARAMGKEEAETRTWLNKLRTGTS